jgi:hypothetical protein
VRLVAALVAVALAAAPAHADPAPRVALVDAPAPPASPRRRAAQGLGITALVLVLGGTASFGAALGEYVGARDGCAAQGGCSASQLLPGKLAQGFGWGLLGAGIAAGVATLLVAWSDSRGEARRLTLSSSPAGIALGGTF